MPINRFQFLLAAPLFFLAFSSTVRANEPTVDELIALAPVIDSADPAFQSIQISGRMKADDKKQHCHFRFRAIYRAPDKYGLFINDEQDGTPLLFANDGKAFVYDPIRDAVFYVKSANPKIAMGANENRFAFGIGLACEKPAKLMFDIRSLFLGPRSDAISRQDDDGTHLLTLTSPRGNLLVGSIDRARPVHYTSIAVVVDKKPVFLIDRILVNETLLDSEFHCPSKMELSRRIEVQELPADSLLTNYLSIGSIIRACYVRAAANDPDCREAIKEVVDWETLKENDGKFSKALNEVLAAPIDSSQTTKK